MIKKKWFCLRWNFCLWKLQRNFGRKGVLRGGNKIGQDHGAGDDTGESISPIGKVTQNTTFRCTCTTLASFNNRPKGNINIWRIFFNFNFKHDLLLFIHLFFFSFLNFLHEKMSGVVYVLKNAGGVVLGGSSTLEKQAVVMGLGSREELGGGGGGGGALSLELAITTAHGSGGAEMRSFRRNSFKRSSQPCSWYLDPRKIFLFCATL